MREQVKEMLRFLIFCIFIPVTLASGGVEWKYGKTEDHVYGPKDWGIVSEHCDEDAQSPVDIVSASAQTDPQLKKLLLVSEDRYGSPVTGKLVNNGHAPTLAIDNSNGFYGLIGGPLGYSSFNLEQFHFHFGRKNDRGSEHTVNGEARSGELHLVFYNDKYPDFATAASKPDGLAVIGVFLKKMKKGNIAVGRLSKLMRKIVEPDSSVEVKRRNRIHLEDLVPGLSEAAYYTYQGSLTTPPCYQSVTWIVLKEPIPVGKKQLKRMRNLKNHEGESMGDNFRPTQPLNNRIVRKFE